MQTGTTLVLILYTWCAFRSGLHVDQRPAAMPLEPKNSVSVTDVVQHWTEAMNENHRADAEFVRYTSAGTKINVYVIKKRRINDCAETIRHLFEPDLTTYDIHAPGETTPVAAAQ